MSAKKPWFKAFTGYADQEPVTGNDWLRTVTMVFHEEPRKGEHRVRITDARELTAEKAVERVLQGLRDGDGWTIDGLRWAAKQVDMTATIKNGKVTVRKVKR